MTIGTRIALKYPPWITYPLALIFLLVIVSMLLPNIRYRSLVKEVERIAYVQQKYFLEKGKFTGNVDKLDITRPSLQEKNTNAQSMWNPHIKVIFGQTKTQNTPIKTAIGFI